jgi:hypothetical protein
VAQPDRLHVLGAARVLAGGLQYVITYTHGYATVPGIIKTTALRLARLAIGRPDGVAQESVAGYSATYLTDDDILSVLQRRIVKRIAVP